MRTVNRRRTTDSSLTVDSKKKQVLLRESSITASTTSNPDGIPQTTASSKRFEKAARLYAFDNIFTQESTQQELCSGTLVDLLHTVVNGNDACLLSYGYPKLGKWWLGSSAIQQLSLIQLFLYNNVAIQKTYFFSRLPFRLPYLFNNPCAIIMY